MSRFADHARFLAAFLRNPRATGSLVPSSRALARTMIDGLGLEEARTIVEIGPGTGAFTGELLERKRMDARLIAIELDGGFVATLESRFPGLEVVNDSAEHLPAIMTRLGVPHADAIVCSLPWSNLPEVVTSRILDSILHSLRPGGRFATYVYLPGIWMPGAWRLRRLLRNAFDAVERTRVVWANVPPAFVCRCTKHK